MSGQSSSDIERGPDFWEDHCSRCSDELAEGRDATLCKECSREIEMKRRERGDRCERCDGHGYIYGTFCDLQRAMNGRDTFCPVCHGSGRVPYEPEDDGRLVPDGGQVEESWVRFRDGFTRIRGEQYEAKSGTRIKIGRQKLMHNFRRGYKPSGPEVPIFQGTESDARYVYEVLDEWFGGDSE